MSALPIAERSFWRRLCRNSGRSTLRCDRWPGNRSTVGPIGDIATLEPFAVENAPELRLPEQVGEESPRPAIVGDGIGQGSEKAAVGRVAIVAA